MNGHVAEETTMAKVVETHPEQLELRAEVLVEMLEYLVERAQRLLTPYHKDPWPSRPTETVETGEFL